MLHPIGALNPDNHHSCEIGNCQTYPNLLPQDCKRPQDIPNHGPFNNQKTQIFGFTTRALAKNSHGDPWEWQWSVYSQQWA
jgi:hypothetical protein